MPDVVDNNPELSFGPRVEVGPPPRQRFGLGLFSAAEPVPFGSEEELNGVWARVGQYTPPDGSDDGPDAFTYGDGCDPADDRTKPIPPGSIVAGADPVTVFAGYRCTPFGWSDEEREAMMRQALDLGEERALERLLVDGQTTNGVTFANPFKTANVNATAQGAFAATMAAVETDLVANYGGLGVVFVSPALLTYMDTFGMFSSDGSSLRTTLGNRLAVNRFLDNGLDASTPVQYCGALEIRRSAAVALGDFKESFTQESNDLTRIIERKYLILTDYPAFDPEA